MIGTMETIVKVHRLVAVIVIVAALTGIAGAAHAQQVPQLLHYEITDLGVLAPEPPISDPEDYFPDASAYGVNVWHAFLLTPVYDPADTIFADDFESGNLSAWTNP